MNRDKSCRIHNCRQDREYISIARALWAEDQYSCAEPGVSPRVLSLSEDLVLLPSSNGRQNFDISQPLGKHFNLRGEPDVQAVEKPTLVYGYPLTGTHIPACSASGYLPPLE